MATVVDVTQVLLNAQHQDTATRTEAEAHLKQFQESNFPSFIASLSAELSNNSKTADSRRLAGLILKNMLDAKEEARKQEMHHRWVALDPILKQHVRDALLSTLHCESNDVRHTAAMVVAKAAAIELPRKEWPTLIQALLANMNVTPGVTGTRQATLETLGYICEEMGNLNDEVLTPEEVNQVLTAVVSGMGATEPNESRLAATTALYNAIEFATYNFDNDNERNYIMSVTCQGTTSPDIRIRVASFECLHAIVGLYYSKMPAYMTELYNITVKAIKEDQEEVSLQALEFWSTLCDTELDLLDQDSAEAPCHHFMKAASPHLIPILLELLTKQEEGCEHDETNWGVAMAAGTCLGLASRVIEDMIVPMVMPFIQANISKNTTPEDWRLREAATFAFGLILDGPNPSAFKDTVTSALGYLLQAMKDPHPAVKDTVAWTIGRIFEFLHSPEYELKLITNETLPPIIGSLIEALKEDSHIVYRVCNAISALAVGLDSYPGGTSPMSPYFKDSIGALLQCAQRHATADHSKVQIAAFEAINDLVRSTSRDTMDTVAQLIQIAAFEAINDLIRSNSRDTKDPVAHLIQVVLPEIVKTFEMPQAASPEALEKQSEVQGQLCGVLQVVIQKLSSEDDTKAAVLPFADQIMETLLRIFQCRSSNVHEEAMLAVGSFATALGQGFNKYLEHFFPYLRTGLTNFQEWQVCLSTVGVLGDVCRAVEESILPYCDEVLSLLLQNLRREDVNRKIKPPILDVFAFGDIALVVGEKYAKYLEPVMAVLKRAIQVSISQASKQDDDSLDYNAELRTGIIDAYSGIMQGIGPALCEQFLKPDVPALIDFVASIGSEHNPDPSVAKAAINMMGDTCSLMQGMGVLLRMHPNTTWFQLLTYCKETPDVQDECQWAVQQIEACMAMAA
eukprot:gene30705-35732_t